MNRTGIEYLDFTWNPLAMRCTPVSEGCKNCWHLRMAHRLAAQHEKFPLEVWKAYAGEEPPVLIEDRMFEPFRRRKPARIGVQFMGDLWHEDIPFERISDVEDVMGSTPEHTYVILTKRPQRMLDWLDWMYREGEGMPGGEYHGLPKNVWLGITVETGERLKERWPLIQYIPAAIKFLSVEPMLDDVFAAFEQGWEWPDWIIVGCESGPGRRPTHIDWIRTARGSALCWGVPFFLKQRQVEGKVMSMPELDGQQWRQFPDAP